MKEPTRRRSSRKSKQNGENTSPYTGRARRIVSANKNTSERRHSSRSASANENASQRKRKRSSSSASEERFNIHKRMLNERVIDAYCWVCHKVGSESICNSCHRVYHQRCLKKIKGNSNQTPVCECYMKRVDGKNDDLDLQKLELKILLRTVMDEAVKENKKTDQKHKEQNQQNNKFCRLFQSWTIESEMLCKVMDLNTIIDRLNGDRRYSSTGQFYLDVKWIYHNCCILYGFNSEITKTALKLEKNFKLELTDMEACPECYHNCYCDKYVHADFFTKVCTNDHEIVWAQLRGSPYWPAKLMSIHSGHAEVRFFGTHDKANILIKKCYKISKEPPLKKSITQVKFQEAKTELSIYVSNYEVIKEKAFIFYPPDTPLEDTYACAKKRYRKNQRRRVTGAKRVLVQENSSDNPDSDKSLNKIKGTHEEPDARTRSTETQERDSGTRRTGSGTPEDSTENYLLGDTKVKYIRSFNDNIPNMDESVGGPISSHSEVMCEMTFTAEHNEPTSELTNEDECVDSSTFHYSSSQAPLNTDFFISIHENPNLLSSACDISSGEFGTSTGVEQHPVNLVDINALSMYSPVVSSSEIPSRLVSSDLNMSNNLPVITSVSHNNSGSGIIEPAGIINDNRSIPDEEDSENNDDIQVINEKKKNTVKVNQYLKNESVLKALIEVLSNSRPELRQQLKTLSTLTLYNFLVMWVEMSSTRFDYQEFKPFNDICRKYVKQLNSLEATKSELEKKVQMLTDEVKMLKESPNNKILLRDHIIQAAAQNVMNAKVKELQANVEQLTSSKKQLTEEAETLKRNLKKAEQEMEVKNLMLTEHMKIKDHLEKCLNENIKIVACKTTQTEEYEHYEKKIHDFDVPTCIQSHDSALLIRNDTDCPAEMATTTGVMTADSTIQQPLKQQGLNISDPERSSMYRNQKNGSKLKGTY